MSDVVDLLVIDFLPEDIAPLRPVDQQAVVSSKERGVKGERHRNSGYLSWLGRCDVALEASPQCLPVTAITPA